MPDPHKKIQKILNATSNIFKCGPFLYGDNEESDLLRFWTETHDKDDPRGKEYFDWLYKKNPAGKANIWVARAEGRIIGQYIVLPLRVYSSGAEFLAAVSVNTMIHKDYRGLGAYNLLEHFSSLDTAEKGFAAVFGLPNKSAYNGSIKAGHNKIGNLKISVKIDNIDPVLLERISGKNAILRSCLVLFRPLINIFLKMFFLGMPAFKANGVKVTEIHGFDRSFDDLWDRIKGGGRTMCVRDKKFLDWRFAEKPDSGYAVFSSVSGGRTSGYAVVYIADKKNGRLGVIVDALAEDSASCLSLIKRSVKYFRDNKVPVMLSMVNAGTQLDKSLSYMGFRSCPDRFRSWPIPVTMKVFSEAASHFAELKRWQLTFGDFDMY